jgi:biopolymer transport protein ExbD
MAIAATVCDNGTPMGEMNTTPLIDVMLVLLIMFIITLPIQTHAVKIDLPVGGDPPPGPPPMSNSVSVTEQGAILWNGTPTSMTGLASHLERTRMMAPQPELRFEPHAQARFLLVDQALAVIKRSGVDGLGFVGNERYGQEF